MKINVAIDGPAGAGKSTIAKILAAKFGLMYINTGYMYRAVTLFALRKNISHTDTDSLVSLVKSLEMYFDNDRLIVNDEDVTSEIVMPYINSYVSNYAAVQKVRELLVELQRNIASNYGVVMDGRDIGTVVLKNAEFKFFLTASPEDRADRRYKELIEKGLDVNYQNILQEIIRRDHIDSTRETDPLVKAQDAIEIDSSNLSITEVVEIMCNHISSSL